MTLIEQLKLIPDPRSMKGRRHELWLVLLLVLLGAMTGYWGYRCRQDFCQVHRATVLKLLALPSQTRLPSYSTW